MHYTELTQSDNTNSWQLFLNWKKFVQEPVLASMAVMCLTENYKQIIKGINEHHNNDNQPGLLRKKEHANTDDAKLPN